MYFHWFYYKRCLLSFQSQISRSFCKNTPSTSSGIVKSLGGSPKWNKQNKNVMFPVHKCPSLLRHSWLSRFGLFSLLSLIFVWEVWGLIVSRGDWYRPCLNCFPIFHVFQLWKKKHFYKNKTLSSIVIIVSLSYKNTHLTYPLIFLIESDIRPSIIYAFLSRL